MKRKKIIAGNWKMHTRIAEARELATGIVKGLGNEDRVTVVVCPPFPWLMLVGDVIKNSPVKLGAQNVHYANEGAYTGEVSPPMLLDAGCHYAIVGHSERRHGLQEPDRLLNQKLKAGLQAGLHIIFCVGETLADREADLTDAVLQFQVEAGLAGLSAQLTERLIIAYEPVWAIGTGKNASPEQAQHAHELIRKRFAYRFGEELAQRLPIQYGGSVKPDNAATLLSQPDVDGALVGGASMKPDSFLAIVQAGIQ